MQTRRRRIAIGHRWLATGWLLGGALLAWLFASGHLPSFHGSILLLAIVTVVGTASLRLTDLSLLSRLFVVLFSLPFSATAGYLIDPEFRWMCAPNLIGISRDPEIMSKMLTMAVIGLCGMMSGMEFVAGIDRHGDRLSRQIQGAQRTYLRTLGWPWFITLLAVSFLLSWLHAPQKTIFEAAYFSAEARRCQGTGTGMYSSYLVSYLILILLYIDAERERRHSRTRSHKFIAIALVAAYIVVVLQFLRGDRECAGLLAGAALLYITNPSSYQGYSLRCLPVSQLRRTLTLALPAVVGILAFVFLETYRHSASGIVFDNPLLAKSIVDRARSNTWTAVARNNLGLTVDYHYGTIEYLHGRTYVDYILSLPPGSVTKLVGYQRPMDGDDRPSKWYVCLSSIGGMHPVVVPFRNFGIWGVIPAMFVCGSLICYCELCNRRGTFVDRLLYGFVATTSMLWCWYGDMNLIRALMAWAILGITYPFLTGAVTVHSLLDSVIPWLDRPELAGMRPALISDWGTTSFIERPIQGGREFAETQIAMTVTSFD